MPMLTINQEGFERAVRRAGVTTNEALARRMQVSTASVSRVRSGKANPSTQFVAGALAAFGTSWFGELFQVT